REGAVREGYGPGSRRSLSRSERGRRVDEGAARRRARGLARRALVVPPKDRGPVFLRGNGGAVARAVLVAAAVDLEVREVRSGRIGWLDSGVRRDDLQTEVARLRPLDHRDSHGADATGVPKPESAPDSLPVRRRKRDAFSG